MHTVMTNRKYKTFFLPTLIVFVAILWSALDVQAQNVSALISRIGDTTHLEFRGRKEWKYDTNASDKTRLVIRAPALDDAAIVQLQSWSCPLVKEIKVDKNAPDGQYEISVYFATPNVEAFDYLTDDPSYLIVDFYQPAPKAEPVAASPATPEAKKTNAAVKGGKKGAKSAGKNVAAAGSEDYKLKDRKPAGSETLTVDPNGLPAVSTENGEKLADIRFERGVFDGGDPNYDRFRVKDYQIREDAVIASKQNIYIRFPTLAQKSRRFSELMKTSPVYEIAADDGEKIVDENKDARFLVSLFNKAEWGAFFETLKYFQTKYPDSKYNEIVKNMKAEAHVRLFQRDGDPKDYESFRSQYRYLIETYPDSVLTERNHLLLAYSSLDKGDGAETLRDLQVYMMKYPNSAERDHARLAIAEAYGYLNKPDDAIKTYEDIIANPQDRNAAIEAAYRLGDVHFDRRDYVKALATYSDVQKKHPAFQNIFPNAQYNKAESEFWLGQYKNSLNDYIDFLKNFPSHTHGGFALTRVGELQAILGVEQPQVMGAFLESYFRYPNSQGAEVARLRMLSQGLKGMKEREKKRALEEIDGIAKRSTLPQFQEFSVLMKSDGLSRRGEYSDSLGLLLAYYQEHPTTSNVKVFKSRILRNISDVLKESTENGQFMEALNFYGKYSTTWLKNADRIDAPYFQAVGFERAGVTKEARKIYVKTLEKLKAISGKKEEKERAVYEHMPTISQLNLRLAAVALEDKQYQDAFHHLSAVRGDLNRKEEIEKVRIGATVAENMGDTSRAISYLENLVTKFKEEPKQVVAPKLDLIKLYLKQARAKDADTHISELEKMHETKGLLSDEDWAKTLELRGDLQLDTKQKLAAVETYSRLLESFEAQYPLNSIRYKAGQILFDEGDLKGAEKIWSRFADGTGDFYRKLASEKLSQANWQDNYKKYIDRIPAAQDLK